MTQHEPVGKPTKPASRTSDQKQRLARAARQLAGLLIEAAPLAEVLSSPDTPSPYRLAVRDMVGHERYFELTTTLNQMSSWRAWEVAHAMDATTRRKLFSPGHSGATFYGKTMTFHARDDEP